MNLHCKISPGALGPLGIKILENFGTGDLKVTSISAVEYGDPNWADLAIKNLPVCSHTPLSRAMVKQQQGKDNYGIKANTKSKGGHMARGSVTLTDGPIRSNKAPGSRAPPGSFLFPHFCFTAIDLAAAAF